MEVLYAMGLDSSVSEVAGAPRTEKELVKQLRQGRASAYEELVSKYGRRLHSVCLRILRHPEDAEDCVQEAFLKTLRSIHSFREDSSLFTWLYRIGTNNALERLRKEGRAKMVPIEPFLPRFEHGQHSEVIADWSHLPDSGIRRRQLSDFLEKCIDELPENYRLAYILKDMEKLSEDQVCRLMKVSRSTMKNRVHRARLIIRRRIEEKFFGESGSPSQIAGTLYGGTMTPDELLASHPIEASEAAPRRNHPIQ